MTAEIRNYLMELEKNKVIHAFLYTPGAPDVDVLYNDGTVHKIICSNLQELKGALEELDPVEDLIQVVPPKPVLAKTKELVFVNATEASIALMEEYDIDPGDVEGTGDNDRILIRDVKKHIESVTADD